MQDSLLSRKQELEIELKHLGTELRELSIEQDDERGGVGNHFADDGSSLGEQERLSAIEGDFRDQLRQVDSALRRIDSGSYGICQRCQKAIPYQRLRALPFAEYCIECQSYLERQSELFGSTNGR